MNDCRGLYPLKLLSERRRQTQDHCRPHALGWRQPENRFITYWHKWVPVVADSVILSPRGSSCWRSLQVWLLLHFICCPLMWAPSPIKHSAEKRTRESQAGITEAAAGSRAGGWPGLPVSIALKKWLDFLVTPGSKYHLIHSRIGCPPYCQVITQH